jgi:hypothetical protein
MKSALFPECDLLTLHGYIRSREKQANPWVQFQTFNFGRLGNLTVSVVDSFVPNPAFQ